MPELADRGKGNILMATALATSLSGEVSLRLLDLPHVVQVFVRRETDICYVWTVVDEFSPEVRETIHRAEQALVADFRPAKFSFRVVPGDANARIEGAERFPRAT